MPEEIDYDNMSDEDFLNAPEPKLPPEGEDGQDGEDDTQQAEEEADVEDTEEDPAEEEEDPGEEEEEDPGERDDPDAAEEEEPEETEEEEDKGADETKDDKETKGEELSAEILAKVLTPFKANGREVKPKSIEDLQRMAQMGIDYSQKMAGMKPARKALKTLENNGLLDESELSMAIEAYKGNPEAITALLKKHSIDPLEIDMKAEGGYTPENHTASDEEVELDTVLESIKGTTTYQDTLNTVTKVWDAASSTEAANNPAIIATINEHKLAGVYDKVMDVVQYERSLGKLAGVSDLDAYRAVGTRMQTEGAFNDQTTQAQPDVSQKAAKTKTPDPAKEAKRVAQKKAASPTRSNNKKIAKLPPNFNPLDLDEEEFNKLDPKLLGIKA